MNEKVAIKKIMIFGRPGSGKSTFACWLSKDLNLPLHHLDKHFYTHNWIERDRCEFLQIQQEIVNGDSWIIDGNSVRSLEMRYEKAQLALYFNFPKTICIWRILKRFLKPNTTIDDRAPSCDETISLHLLKYLLTFEKRVAQQIQTLKAAYPAVIFKEITNDAQLKILKHDLTGKYCDE